MNITIWQLLLGSFLILMGLSYFGFVTPAVLMAVLGIAAGIAVLVGK